jgi:glyoxylase-like metal-dependent hydrolase (beta-lactamase superfamily II)
VAECQAVAETAEEIVPGVWYWAVQDERIGGHWGASHATNGVLIDPHRLAEDALAGLGEIRATVLTTSSHQRSAWRFRRELGAPVHLPALAKEMDEEPDARYGDGDELPGGLRAIFTPGAGTTQHALFLAGDPGVLFTSDLFVRSREGPLEFVPAEYMHDPDEARRTAERLLEVDFDVLCSGHGVPLVGGAKRALEELLAK